MSAAARPRWEELRPQLQQLLKLKKLDKAAAQSATTLAGATGTYMSTLPRDSVPHPQTNPQLVAAAPLVAKAAAHVLSLLAQQKEQHKDAAALEACLMAAYRWLFTVKLGWLPFDASAATTITHTFASTGLLVAMSAFCKLLTRLLDKPDSASAATYSSCDAAIDLYQKAVVLCPKASLMQQPLLAAAAAPILTACLAVLRHKPAAAAAAAASPLPGWRSAKQNAVNLMRTLSYRICSDNTDDDVLMPTLLSATILGAPDMLPLLLTHLAVDAGCYWHRLPQGQSALQAPRKVPLRGFGGGSSSSSSSAGQRPRAQQLQSTDVEPSHVALLEHLGVILPPLDSLGLTTQPVDGEQAALLNPLECLLMITNEAEIAARRRDVNSSSNVLSTATLCRLLPVLLEVLLVLDAQRFFDEHLLLSIKLTHFTSMLLMQWSNTPGTCSNRRFDHVAVPAPDSEVRDTALHMSRLLLHHVVPAMLYVCKHPPASLPAEHHAKNFTLIRADQARFVRWFVQLAIGGNTTKGSWQQLATTERAAISALIEQQPLQSLLALELALRHDCSGGSPFTHTNKNSSDAQFGFALALFGVPEEGGWADRSFHELGLLSPQLLAAAGADNPPGLRRRMLSLFATGLKLAVREAEAAPPIHAVCDGVLPAGLVTSICHAFGAFCSLPPRPDDWELRQEMVAMMARLLHAAGRVGQLLYERARPLPTSGRMPSILLIHAVFDSIDGHWLAVIKLRDMWQAVEDILDASGSVLLTTRLRLQQQQQQQQQQQMPDGVLQSLLQREDKLEELYGPPRRQIDLVSELAWAEACGSSVAFKWRDLVPGWLDQATQVAAALQAHGADLAALCPRNYLCNNLECLVMEQETESAAAAKMCSQCKQARYCCAACQRVNWRTLHKPTCSRLQAAATPAAAGGSSTS